MLTYRNRQVKIMHTVIVDLMGLMRIISDSGNTIISKAIADTNMSAGFNFSNNDSKGFLWV